MTFSPFGVAKKYKIEVFFINLIILLYLFRTVIPLLKFPYILLYFSFIIYSLINYFDRIKSTFKEFVRIYYLILFLAVILFISFLLSNKLYLTIFKDVVNTVILISLLFILNLIITENRGLKFFVSNLVYLIVLFSVVISALELLNILSIVPYFDISQNIKTVVSSTNVSYEVDYNFALVPVFFGIIGILYLLNRPAIKLQKYFYNFLFVIFSLCIILSGSRRGLILFIILFLILLTAKLVTLFKKDSFFGRIESNSGIFLLLVTFITILLNVFLFKTSFEFKTKTLEKLGSRNIVLAKYNLAKSIYRYSSALNRNVSFSETFWIIAFDPSDPDSGWGDRIHKTIFPLSGNNVEIVPSEAKGYLMDNTCNGSYYPSIDLCESFTMGVDLKVNDGDRCKASVYCFVSDSSDVSSVVYGVGSACIDKKIVSGRLTSSYNLERKGIWQKLEVDFTCNKGEVPIYLSFWKKGVKDFSKTKGFVIFAYPTYKKIEKTNSNLSEVSFSDRHGKKPWQYGKTKVQPRQLSYLTQEESNSTINNISNDRNYKFNENMVKNKYLTLAAFSLPMTYIDMQIDSVFNQDPVRELASKMISEDTTYFPYKNEILVDANLNKYGDERLVRWIFAYQIYSKEFNWKQKLFGGGFNFLNWYGYYFLNDKTKSDWPHNPFLSVLLYSGLLGLAFYSFFVYKVFYYYIKYIKEYPLLFIFFIITFFFSFFSGGSPFDPPVMGFFNILPFFIHAVHKKKNLE